MNYKKIIMDVVLVSSIILTAFFAFAQETAVIPAASVVPAVDQAVASGNENDTQWAWGEVTSLDAQAKTFTLKYLDYETDQEKDLVLAVNEKTTFENIKGLEELKLKDTLSIDYLVGADNQNIAKNISLEQPDAVAPAAPIVQEAKPTDLEPAKQEPVNEVLSTTDVPAQTPVPTEPEVKPEVAPEAAAPVAAVDETSSLPSAVSDQAQ